MVPSDESGTKHNGNTLVCLSSVPLRTKVLSFYIMKQQASLQWFLIREERVILSLFPSHLSIDLSKGHLLLVQNFNAVGRIIVSELMVRLSKSLDQSLDPFSK